MLSKMDKKVQNLSEVVEQREAVSVLVSPVESDDSCSRICSGCFRRKGIIDTKGVLISINR
jgi:hypothetical protein